MKRVLVAFALVLAAAFVHAQDLSNLSTATRLAYQYLSSEGFQPWVDEDNDVCFKAEGHGMYFDTNLKDPTMLRLVVMPIYGIDMDDDAQVLAAFKATNEFNRFQKLIRPGVVDDGRVFFYADTYIGNAKKPADLSEFIDCAIDFANLAFDSWQKMLLKYYSE